MSRGWLARVDLTIGQRTTRHRLPSASAVTVGRGHDTGARIEEPWVSRNLVTCTPVEQGWTATMGESSRVTLSGIWVEGQATLVPGATVLLGEGSWALEWPQLDHPCRMAITVWPKHLAPRVDAPYLVQSRPRQAVGTDFAAMQLDLDDLAAYRLAVIFRHVIEDEPAPHRLYETRAVELGLSVSDVRNLVNRTRIRLNRRRECDLADHEALGDYLVRVSNLIGEDDLSP